MSVASNRLDLYLAAEARILEAQMTRKGDQQRLNTQLIDVQKQIAILQRTVANEGNSTIGPRVLLADFRRGEMRGDDISQSPYTSP